MKKHNQPRITLVTVNFNGKKFLKPLLDSLQALEYPADRRETIVVDNGSADGSVDFIRENFPNIKLIEHNQNNYCQANNLAIRQARGKFVGLVNNDVVLDPQWANALIASMNTDLRIGAATGKTIFANGKIQNTGHYEFPHYYWGDRGFQEADLGQYQQPQEIPSLSHCACLYRKECLDDIGELDENFGFYLEDVDCSLRARARSWKLFYVPGAIATHAFHGTADEQQVTFYCERNRLFLIAKHFPQKLSDELLGQGYFTALNQKTLLGILPEVLSKLFKHHDQKKVMELFPDLFNSLDKILNMEHDFLTKELQAQTIAVRERDSLIQEKNTDINKLDRTMEEHKQLLRNKESEIQFRKDRLQEVMEILETNKTPGYKLKDKVSCLLDQMHHRELEIAALKKTISEIYESETYRFIAKPVWKILSFLRRLKTKSRHVTTPEDVLVIKTLAVGLADAAGAIAELQGRYPAARIRVLAHVEAQEVHDCHRSVSADELMIFNRSSNPLRGRALMKTALKLRQIHFDEVIVLSAISANFGFTKARLLASAIGAKRIMRYGVFSKNLQPVSLAGSLLHGVRVLLSMIALSVLAVVFVFWIVIPLKIRRLIHR
ncbi:MAG: glycosyltransferase [Candidatus Omnitrophota bacterium]